MFINIFMLGRTEVGTWKIFTVCYLAKILLSKSQTDTQYQYRFVRLLLAPSDAIEYVRKLYTNPANHSHKSTDDFLYVDRNIPFKTGLCYQFRTRTQNNMI